MLAGQRRSPRAERGDDCGRAPKRCGDSGRPHGSGGSRRSGRAASAASRAAERRRHGDRRRPARARGRYSPRGGWASWHAHRNARGPAVSEERLCRRVREDARGGPDRSRRRSARSCSRLSTEQSLRGAKHSADARPHRSCHGRAARASKRSRFPCICIATISFSTTPLLSRRRSSGCTARSCRPSTVTTICPSRYRSASTRSACITRPAIVRAASVSRLGRREQEKQDLFVGDTLFAGSIGRTDLPGGDYATLMRSITQVLFSFGDDGAGVFRPRAADDDWRRSGEPIRFCETGPITRDFER